jgi:hypothetical protein
VLLRLPRVDLQPGDECGNMLSGSGDEETDLYRAILAENFHNGGVGWLWTGGRQG